MSDHVTPAPAQASSRTGTIQRRWARAATSGTIPPDGAWSATCDATTFEMIRRPPSTRAMPGLVARRFDGQQERAAHAVLRRPGRSAPASRRAVARSRAIRSRIRGSPSGSVVMISASSLSSL